MSEKMLKLAATDKEDIVVLSALLQDAVVPASEMIYQLSNAGPKDRD